MNKIITYNLNNVNSTIYISDLESVLLYIKNEDIKKKVVILTFMGKNPFKYSDIDTTNIEHYFFKVNDLFWEKISNIFIDTYDVIYNSIIQGKDVILHCRMGISRSVTILIAFFLTCLKKSPHLIIPYIPKLPHYNWTNSILFWIREKRKIAQPNMGFMEQLYRYERE